LSGWIRGLACSHQTRLLAAKPREQIKGIQNANVQNKRVTLSSATMGCVSHCGLAIYIFQKKKYLKKEEYLWKLKYFSPCKRYNLQNNPLKETQNPLRYSNSIITNLKLSTQAKIYHVSKILISK